MIPVPTWLTSLYRPPAAPRPPVCDDPATAAVLHAVPALPAGARGRAVLARKVAEMTGRWRDGLLCEIGAPEDGAAAPGRAEGVATERHETAARAEAALAGRAAPALCLRMHGAAAPTGAPGETAGLVARARAVLLDMTGAMRAGRAAEVIAAMRGCGFVPVLRDRHRGDTAFSMLFLRAGHAADFGPATLDRAFAETRTRPPRGPSGRRYPDAGIPVVVPVFENPTFARMMVSQLRGVGFSDIVLVDNASRSPEMLACLEEMAPLAHVERLEDNIGPRKTLKRSRVAARLPRYFAATDPDIGFNPALPADFVAVLKAALSEFDVAKAGFALDISDRAALVETRFEMKGERFHIWEQEEKFWADFAGDTASGDPAFRAGLDTTFAVYDRKRFRKRHFLEAVRVGGRFTAQHLPWLRAFRLDPAEQRRYLEAQMFSHYQAQTRPAP